MNTEARRDGILERLKRDGRVHVRKLVESLSVSDMTVRRDLEYLEGQGHLVRTYGGAMSAVGLTLGLPYAAKASERTKEKDAIAGVAAELVKDGDLVLIDAGSTTGALAHALRGRRNLTVVTVDLKVAVMLCDEPGIQVLVTGGTAQPEGYNLFGPLAEQTLRGLTVDLAFLGTDAVDEEIGLTTPSLEKVAIKQAMLRAARRSVLLADASKFGWRTSFQICPLSALSLIITDRTLSPDLIHSFKNRGVDIDLA